MADRIISMRQQLYDALQQGGQEGAGSAGRGWEGPGRAGQGWAGLHAWLPVLLQAVTCRPTAG